MVLHPDLNLDTLINNESSFHLIKNDLSTTVGVLKGKTLGLPHDLLVKRFNYRGLIDFCIHRISGSRAKRLWDINVRLYRRELPVPKPVAYIEPSLKQKNSFYLSYAIDNADNLSNIYKKGILHKNRDIVHELAGTLVRWHLAGAVHGDLKWPNILLQKGSGGHKFLFIDLDQTKIYPSPSLKGITRDLKRFYRFGLELGAEGWVEKDFFPEYLNIIPETLKHEIDLSSIKKASFEEWARKGKKRY